MVGPGDQVLAEIHRSMCHCSAGPWSWIRSCSDGSIGSIRVGRSVDRSYQRAPVRAGRSRAPRGPHVRLLVERFSFRSRVASALRQSYPLCAL
jgi:hypothetical protein